MLSASFKSNERRTAKMMAKSNWFKSREEQGKSVQPSGMKIQPSGRLQDKGFPQDRSRTNEDREWSIQTLSTVCGANARCSNG